MLASLISLITFMSLIATLLRCYWSCTNKVNSQYCMHLQHYYDRFLSFFSSRVTLSLSRSFHRDLSCDGCFVVSSITSSYRLLIIFFIPAMLFSISYHALIYSPKRRIFISDEYLNIGSLRRRFRTFDARNDYLQCTSILPLSLSLSFSTVWLRNEKFILGYE